MTSVISNPFSLWLDGGVLIDGGSIYIGASGSDPEAVPIAVYWDEALTIMADQPLRTRGGYIVNESGNPSRVYTAPDDYSIRVRDAAGSVVAYLASTIVLATAFQPLDADLTAISGLVTVAYGRSLLTLANSAALKAATGIPDPIPSVGGGVTGNITRVGAGPHLYHANGALSSGQMFVTVNGAADPTSQPGQLWFEEAP